MTALLQANLAELDINYYSRLADLAAWEVRKTGYPIPDLPTIVLTVDDTDTVTSITFSEEGWNPDEVTADSDGDFVLPDNSYGNPGCICGFNAAVARIEGVYLCSTSNYGRDFDGNIDSVHFTRFDHPAIFGVIEPIITRLARAGITTINAY